MNLHPKFTWLIDEIRRAERISLEDLSDRWERKKDLSDCKPLSRATFDRWRNAIREQFGIDIVCQKSGGYSTISPIRRRLTTTSSRNGCSSRIRWAIL